jgi:RHS repeat-associated protein
MKHIVLARIDAGYAYDGTAAIMMHFRLVLTQRSVQQAYKFTGKERDTESGLDNFGARYDASSLGRFMTPDWAAKPTTVPYARFGDPQSLNLYSYVRNNPLSRNDPDGHYDLNASRCAQGNAKCQ